MKYECKLYLDEEEGKPAADIKIKLDGVKDLRAILREKKKHSSTSTLFFL